MDADATSSQQIRDVIPARISSAVVRGGSKRSRAIIVKGVGRREGGTVELAVARERKTPSTTYHDGTIGSGSRSRPASQFRRSRAGSGRGTT